MAKNRCFATPTPRNPSVYGDSRHFAYIYPIISHFRIVLLLIRVRAPVYAPMRAPVRMCAGFNTCPAG